MLTSIIIPTYNGLPLLQSCIQAIQQHTSEPYEIIVVDNGSKDGTNEYCRSMGFTFASLAVNKGFPIACNIGLRMAAGDQLLLLNNDVIVSKDWLKNLLAGLYSGNDVGLIGPTSNRVSGRQQIRLNYQGLDGYPDAAARYMSSHEGVRLEVKRLVGFCLLFRRKVMEDIGLLDERFTPGHYEDDDYCYRARLRGYRLLIARDCYVHHLGSASFKRRKRMALRRLIANNRRKFIRKWGVHPGQFHR
ncbi:glycosyltransferase family 2 protein [Paenibacillus senegalensis]|uniref:glycosyltransferase family 2 protein n=1 Tax=Paenibacillus senegalensis TaxID=1465766 RepID=UPI0002893A8E|nr:glycosyltransferase family 2 protein [Paenibacillus senegalensis]